MKVTDIKVHIIQPGDQFRLAAYGSHKAEIGIVRVLTDEGIEGNMDYTTPGQPCRLLGELIAALKPSVVGEDPFHTERIWKKTFKSTRFLMSIYAPGCVNAALWDIVGKALNVPLYRLLGGFRERIRAYASTRSYETIDDFITLAASLVKRGFTAIKLHPFGDPDRDIDLCRAMRKAVGDHIDLMLDPMGLYERNDALRVGKVLDELHFYWYEEPLPDSDVEGYVELCRRLDLPVVGIDTLRLSLGNFTDYVARGAFDMLQADAARQGITWVMKLAAIAEGFGLRLQGHASGPPLHQAANLHVMGGISNGDFFEMPVPEGINSAAMKDVITLDSDGYVTMPRKPGLGLELDWGKVDKMTNAVIG